MAGHSIFPFAKKYGLDLERAGEAIYGACLAVFPDPPELDEDLQKQLTPLATLQKAPLLSRLIPTNLQMGNVSSKTVDGFVHEDDSPIVQSTVESTGEKMVRMNELPKTVDGFVREDDSPIVPSTVESTGEKMVRMNELPKTVDEFVREDDSPIVPSTVESTGEKKVRMNELPKTVDGFVHEDDRPSVPSTVESTGEQLQRMNKLSNKLSVCKDKSPIVRSHVENQDHLGAGALRLFRDGKRYYGCTGCDFVKVSRAAVLGHIKRLSNANLDTCDCGYVTSNPQCFRQHMLHCTNRFVCMEPNCEFTTTRKFVLKRHLVSHSEQRFNLWKCDFCDATFTLKSNKKRHEQYFHIH